MWETKLLKGIKSAVALAAVMVTASLGTAPTDAAIKLRITTQLPRQNPVPQNLYHFEEIVEDASDGAIQVDVFDSAQLYKDKEVPKAVASGAIEMGSAPLTRFVGTTPVVDLFFTPFVFESFDAVMEATQPGHIIRETIEAEILKTGARVLWWQPFGMAVMLSNGEPIDAPTKMEGKKVRAFGKAPGAFVEALGGAPTVMSGSEQFLAYQRGTVDAGMTAVTAVKSRNLYEVMDYMTLTNHAVAMFVVIINDALWMNLDDSQRRIITDAARQAERKLKQSYSKAEAEVIEWIEENTGMEVIELSDPQRRAFQEASASVVDDFVEEAGLMARELVEEARQLQ